MGRLALNHHLCRHDEGGGEGREEREKMMREVWQAPAHSRATSIEAADAKL